MKAKEMLITALGCLGAMVALGQTAAPPAAPQSGPGVQAAQDAKYPEWIAAKCKNPPAARGGGGGGRAAGGAAAAAPAAGGQRAAAGDGRGNAAAGPPVPVDYTIKAIPGVIAAGQKWKEIVEIPGNNADGDGDPREAHFAIAQSKGKSGQSEHESRPEGFRVHGGRPLRYAVAAV